MATATTSRESNLDAVTRLGSGLAFIAFPLVFVYAFGRHPNLLTPHLLGPEELIQRAHGDSALQFAHVLVTLNRPSRVICRRDSQRSTRCAARRLPPSCSRPGWRSRWLCLGRSPGSPSRVRWRAWAPTPRPAARRWRAGDVGPAAFVSPGSPAIPLVGTVVSLGLLAGASRDQMAAGLVAVACGAVLYLAARRVSATGAAR